MVSADKSEANSSSDELLFDNLISMKQLLEMFKHEYSKHTIYRWVQQYSMPHKRISGKLWFPKTDVIRWWLGRSQ
jgi:predicted DNA-binding transcriptional regulator AlpA